MQSVGVDPQKQRAIDFLESAVVANRLRDCQDMTFIERYVKRRSAVA